MYLKLSLSEGYKVQICILRTEDILMPRYRNPYFDVATADTEIAKEIPFKYLE
jgi:hypothetical protein